MAGLRCRLCIVYLTLLLAALPLVSFLHNGDLGCGFEGEFKREAKTHANNVAYVVFYFRFLHCILCVRLRYECIC